MLATKLFFCFAATFLIFSGVESLYTPSDVVKLTCEAICEGHLVGKTYSCNMYSSRGMVTAIVRMIIDLNWRFYVIPKIKPQIRLCQRIAAADKYFINGTNKCPSSFRSSTDDVDQIDSSSLQSSLRLEDMKDLLQELNKDTTDVLKDLESSSNGNGLRSLKQTFTYSKKVQIELVLEKLVEHLSVVDSLKHDVKYHVNINSQTSLSSQSSQFGSLPDPSDFNHTSFPNEIPHHLSQHNHKSRFDHNNFDNYDHNTKFDSENVHDYNIKFDTKNLYNMNSNSDNYQTYYEDRNYGINYNYESYATGKRGSSFAQVDDVKQLAYQLKEESSQLLNQLNGGLLWDASNGKDKLFGSLVNHLNGFMGLVNNFDSNLGKTFNRAEIDVTKQFNNDSNSDSDDSSQSVEDYPPPEPTSDSKSNKRKFIHDTSDEHGECVLCSVVLKDVCSDGNIIVCNERICCWMPLNPYYCMTSLTDKTATTCYNSVFSILQSARLH